MKSRWLVFALLVALAGGCSKSRVAMEAEESAPAADTVAQARTAAAPSGQVAPPPAMRSRQLIRRLDVGSRRSVPIRRLGRYDQAGG